ncbi:MAG: sigma-54-dependent Fis family transcriptional regulator [Calditrichaeota bacterium]|nr:MAG: sigma-54-dependent Fis family transcriptional regulator [Calditrichota bacterium]
MNKEYRVAIVDDNETMRDGLEQVINLLGFPVNAYADAESCLQNLATEQPHIVIADFKMPGKTGLELIREIKEKYPGIETVLITAFSSIDLAVQAMQAGAADFISKPFSADEIGVKIERICKLIASNEKISRLSAENQYLRDEEKREFNNGEIIGESSKMQQVFRTVQKVAITDAAVIIYGETGTGKELIARALHQNSSRADQPFIRINCGALAETILESELFGHEKGAFTGALKRKAGRFELADAGTIFLDEVSEISTAMQVKLLRVLQEKEFERVGGEETLQVDVRVIAATNKSLQELVDKGDFREDLYYRLHVVPITLPALRDREADIALLTQHFIKRFARRFGHEKLELDTGVAETLQNYNWPGNIRELENVLERASVLCENSLVSLADLPPLLNNKKSVFSFLDDNLDLNHTLDQVEKNLIERAMQTAHGVKAEAARLLGIKTTTLLYKLSRLGMD